MGETAIVLGEAQEADVEFMDVWGDVTVEMGKTISIGQNCHTSVPFFYSSSSSRTVLSMTCFW